MKVLRANQLHANLQRGFTAQWAWGSILGRRRSRCRPSRASSLTASPAWSSPSRASSSSSPSRQPPRPKHTVTTVYSIYAPQTSLLQPPPLMRCALYEILRQEWPGCCVHSAAGPATSRGDCEGSSVMWCAVGQASVNPKVETVEELLGRRKNLHMGMTKLARDDLALSLQNGIEAFAVAPHPHSPPSRHSA
jgi:hypothetical protein